MKPSLTKLPNDKPIISRVRAERSLGKFIQQAWPVIEPGTTYLHNWHIEAIAEYLQAVDAGQITRLLINIPPRYMKSITVSVMWPVWSWINHPESRWLFASYSGSLSTKHSVDRRTIIQSDWYQQHWGDRFKLTTDQNVKTEYQNDKRGVMVSTSFGGTATGKGAGKIIIDDPHNPEESESDVIREGVLTSFDRTFSTRLDDKKTGAIVVVMQRLHEKDVSARCKEQGYTHLCLPAECESDTTISLPSGKKIERKAGALLWPEREGPREIAQAKLQLGSYGYAGQYQQKPAPSEGGKFNVGWFRYAKRENDSYRLIRGTNDRVVKVDDCQRFAICDIAGTEKRASNDPDYSVCAMFDLTDDGDLILFDLWRDTVEIPDVERAIVRLSLHHDIPMVGVEWANNGIGVAQTLRRRGVPVRGIKAKGSKVVRAMTAQIRMEGGSVFFIANAPWLPDAEAELLNFPNGAHDDVVDCVAYAAIHAQRIAGVLNDDRTQALKDRREADAEEQDKAEIQEHTDTRELALESAARARRGDDTNAFAGFGEDDD